MVLALDSSVLGIQGPLFAFPCWKLAMLACKFADVDQELRGFVKVTGAGFELGTLGDLGPVNG